MRRPIDTRLGNEATDELNCNYFIRRNDVINSHLVLTGAVVASLVIGVEAQAPKTTAPAQKSTASQNATNEKKVHLEGCVFPKRALSSPTPVMVAPNSTEDFVVTDTKVISVSPGLGDLDGHVFTLNDVDRDRLRELNGKRVGVSARLADAPDMAGLDVISIHESVGGCPPVPTPEE
jgi:hypothetical protein